MSNSLCLTVRFLDPEPRFHGRDARGEPEWPPSPVRLFQALVSAAATRWREEDFSQIAQEPLKWLEKMQPSIVAPAVNDQRFGFRMYVPNNSGDLMTAAWARGDTETSMAKFRVEKDVRPSRLLGEVVRYVFPLADGTCPHFETIRSAMRSLTHLGWGLDMVAGDAELLNSSDLAQLSGETWIPTLDGEGIPLRSPIAGTLDNLIRKHHAFLNRITASGFQPAPPLSMFKVTQYRRTTDPALTSFATFSILQPDASGMKAFNTFAKTRDVVGMLRNATARVARQQGWNENRINQFVHGKSTDGSKPLANDGQPDRFQYLALPTINPLGRVESIRRVIVAAPPHCSEEIAWARRALSGAELIFEDHTKALLTILPNTDWVLKNYIGSAVKWTTVTPVILPGYDDPDHLRRKLRNCHDADQQKSYLRKLDERTERLLRKSFRQAGFPEPLVKQLIIEWSGTGFQSGIELASRYLPPENLNRSTRLHVRVQFPISIRGPLAIGSGRFRGFGLFARTE